MVAQQIPLEVILAPPVSVIFPPEIADEEDIDEIDVVDIVGN